MSIPYESSTVLDTPKPNGESYIEYPFKDIGDIATKIYHLVCVVKKGDYTPIALDTTMASAGNADVTDLPFTADANAYHIGDYNNRIVDGVFEVFDRQFSNIPADNSINSGTEIYSFPGLLATAGTGTEVAITSMTQVGNTVSVNKAAAHGITSGTNFNINAKIYRTGSRFGYVYYIYGIKQAISASGSSVTYRGTLNGTYQSGSGKVRSGATRGRAQVSRVSSTQIARSYYLPGVTTGITEPQDVAIEQPFAPYRYSEGNDVTSLNSATTPTNVEYNEVIDSDGYLIMNEDVKVWKGNIIVKESKQIRAI